MTKLLSLSFTLDVTIGSAVCAKLLCWPSHPLPQSACQVCTIMCAEAEACMCEWGCLLLHLLPVSLLHHPLRCIFLQETRHCGWGCHSHNSFSISIISSSVSAASTPSWRAFIFHKRTPPFTSLSSRFLTHILGSFTLSHLPLPFCSTQQSPSPPSTLP